MGIVNRVVNQASCGLSSIGMRSIKDFLVGNWNRLTEVDNDVKAACSYAVNTLNAVFSLEFRRFPPLLCNAIIS